MNDLKGSTQHNSGETSKDLVVLVDHNNLALLLPLIHLISGQWSPLTYRWLYSDVQPNARLRLLPPIIRHIGYNPEALSTGKISWLFKLNIGGISQWQI